MKINLTITNDKTTFIPKVLEGIEWETERFGVAGKLVFKVLFKENQKIEEGDIVKFSYDGKGVFYGYIFSLSIDKEKIITITAFDQLKYLKNKEVFFYREKKASQVIKMIADDFNLKTGEIEDTVFLIKKRLEDNVSLFDIIQTALNITLQNTKKMYVLYDDFGFLTLKNVEKMVVDFTIDEKVSENFSFNSNIENSANQVKVYKTDEKAGKREWWVEKDSKNIKKWGVLQYLETLEEGENPILKAQTLLKLYNRKFKSLSIKGVFGDVRVRAGVTIYVVLNLGLQKVENRMLVEKVKHIFNFQEHSMDIVVRGADIQ